MKCSKCQNENECYDGNHELTRIGCADNDWCCFAPITNADKIRAMTDEELATFLTNNQIEVFRKVVKEMCNLLDVYFQYEKINKEVTDKYEEMKKEQLDWLRQEVSE